MAGSSADGSSSNATLPPVPRRLPIGAEVQGGGAVHFRVWAPLRSKVEVVLDGSQGSEVGLTPEPDGYHSGLVPHATAGTRYRYRLDGGDCCPDPASRFQPDGPHGPSEVVDPGAFAWRDESWPGLRLEGQVLYELHIGTFTDEGTWAAAAGQLPRLKELGITAVEVMPVAEFAGKFGWGYDGVSLFAPYRGYGSPDDMRRFVDRAHGLGLGVLLDVVYNHFGPDGDYHDSYSGTYVHSDRGPTGWGKALNFDGEGSAPVREFFVSNAGYWIDEFHLDGLRLDAVQAIHDTSKLHVVTELTRHARAAAGRRTILVVAEDERQKVSLVKPVEKGGNGLDAVWNDDFHHASRVALTGHAEAYYCDYRGTPQELISAVKWGYLFQGQLCKWQQKLRGTPTYGIDAARFITYLENHDQVANSATGARIKELTSPGRYRAMVTLWLLAPQTPMLFQGQELGSSRPFLYFCDHNPELREIVRKGRQEELSGFRSTTHPAMLGKLPDPSTSFEASRLDPPGDYRSHPAFLLFQDLLTLRREDPIFRSQCSRKLEGAVLGPEAFALRLWGDDPAAGDEDCRLILVNLGRDLYPASNSEPLLAPPEDHEWELLCFSEDPRYGGAGMPPLDAASPWRLAGHGAVVLAPRASTPRPDLYEMAAVEAEDFDIHPQIRRARSARRDEPDGPNKS
ncbi:Malto-oligosyltrehalose trehalohydrolase [Aquisphaera giovannonii]|uniref:Malto-oligosyltrehalose trehalohydrolase n=1 Tax=Aquisphaera giovannonii TaxID=406548 RepID=A0A5B9WAJ9_9BACT|nr:malto-oligosyltrehalose trehalohydrolase [Aquisphaera giovannonii]QEH37125.1 Malto-oligosyltrehalose trehalohydrolase [Aquisphaera giovannonii]